jgi:hypothetical protein
MWSWVLERAHVYLVVGNVDYVFANNLRHALGDLMRSFSAPLKGPSTVDCED